MKIISSSKDVKSLIKSDQYIIVDKKAKNPEDVDFEFLKNIQDEIEKKFSTEKKEIIKKETEIS